jgi:hypothetical protein
MVSHTSGQNPDHAGPGPAGPTHWPVNSANRFDRGPRPPLLPTGHRHRSSLRMVHEMLACRGVVEAVRLFDAGQLARAAEASRYFELEDLADLLDRARNAAQTAQAAEAFDEEYRRRFVTGTAMTDAVAHKMTQSPSDFPE